MTFDTERFLEIAAKRGLGLGRPLTFQAVTQSTNDDALAGAREGAPHGALYVAELQTKGRGRRGNVARQRDGARVTAQSRASGARFWCPWISPSLP